MERHPPTNGSRKVHGMRPDDQSNPGLSNNWPLGPLEKKQSDIVAKVANERYPSFAAAKLTDPKQVKALVEQMVAESERKGQGRTLHGADNLCEITQQYLTQVGMATLLNAASTSDRRLSLGTTSCGSHMDMVIKEPDTHTKDPGYTKPSKRPLHKLKSVLRVGPSANVPSHVIGPHAIIPPIEETDEHHGAHPTVANLLRNHMERRKRHRALEAKHREGAEVFRRRLEQAEELESSSMRHKLEKALRAGVVADRQLWDYQRMADSRSKVKVIVVGAGLAGLSAANELFEQGFTNITVLEASDRAGGRMQTLWFGGDCDGGACEPLVTSCEIGAPAWVSEDTMDTVYTLAKNCGLLNSSATFRRPHLQVVTPDGRLLDDKVVSTALRFCQNAERDACFLHLQLLGATRRHRASLTFSDFRRVRQRHLLAGVPEDVAPDLCLAVDAVGTLWRSAAGDSAGDLSADLSGFHSNHRDIPVLGPSQELEIEQMRKKSGPPSPRKVAPAYSSRKNTLSHHGFLARGSTSLRKVRISCTAEIIKCLAQSLPNGTVRCRERVHTIDWSSFCNKTVREGNVPQVKLTVSTAKYGGGARNAERKKTYLAHHVVLAVPLGHLKKFGKGMFTPPLPEQKQVAVERTGVGTVSKVFLYYSDRPPWRSAFHVIWAGRAPTEDGYNPASLSSHRLQISTTFSSLNVLLLTMLGELPAKAATDDQHLAAEVWTIISTGNRKLLRNSSGQRPEPARIVRSSWGHDPLYLGSHPYLARGNHTSDVSTLARPLMFRDRPVIQFAGDYTWPDYGRLAHAARSSGLREGQRLANFYNEYFGHENSNSFTVSDRNNGD